MHYDYFDFRHSHSDAQRVKFLQDLYEDVLPRVFKGSGRSVGRVLKFLRESDFYALPCRHHPFVGGTAWHQAASLVYAYADHCPPDAGSECRQRFQQWQPQWRGLTPMSVALVCLLHDVGNAHHPKLFFPDRIMRRHGRKSTFVLKDTLHLDLMFDENMAILHHAHADEDALRADTASHEDALAVWSMPLFHMACCCDSLAAGHRFTETELTERLAAISPLLAPTDYSAYTDF